jgi:hypothetical protein
LTFNLRCGSVYYMAITLPKEVHDILDDAAHEVVFQHGHPMDEADADSRKAESRWFVDPRKIDLGNLAVATINTAPSEAQIHAANAGPSQDIQQPNTFTPAIN